MPDDLVTERLETLVLARLTGLKKPPTIAALARDLHRYAPAGVDAARWRSRLVECVSGLAAHGVVDRNRHVMRNDELVRRTGARRATWRQLSGRILPGLALGVRADQAKVHERLDGRDNWSAAIVARAHGWWSKPLPPTDKELCDAVIWHALDLGNSAKRCPPEIRAHFLRSYIEMDAAPPDRMLRQLAAKLIGAPRAELKAFYSALIRCWLVGKEPGAHPVANPLHTGSADPRSAVNAAAPNPAGERGAEIDMPPLLIEAVRNAAREARDGVFGDRKVFISSVWHTLRATPPWSALELDEFKQRLVAAHRQRELVLARADLVAAMDPALVAASETQAEGATFHFIVREPMQ